MITGALAGFAAAYAAAIRFWVSGRGRGGAAISLLFAALTQLFLANQVASGLALTLFGLGLAAMFGKPFEGVKATAHADRAAAHQLDRVAGAGDGAGRLVVPEPHPGAAWSLRGVGENHEAAHALGYDVRLTRLAAIAFGGAMAGIGGAFHLDRDGPAMDRGDDRRCGLDRAGDRGLLELDGGGVVLAGAWLFGGVTVLQLRLQAAGVQVPVQLLSMAPYLATIIVLVAISARQKYSRRAGAAAPGSLGNQLPRAAVERGHTNQEGYHEPQTSSGHGRRPDDRDGRPGHGPGRAAEGRLHLCGPRG